MVWIQLEQIYSISCFVFFIHTYSNDLILNPNQTIFLKKKFNNQSRLYFHSINKQVKRFREVTGSSSGHSSKSETKKGPGNEISVVVELYREKSH